MTTRFDTLEILEMLSLLLMGLDIDTIGRHYITMTNEIFFFPITASVGVATFGGKVFSVDNMLAKADKALSAAKTQGRNRVCLAE